MRKLIVCAATLALTSTAAFTEEVDLCALYAQAAEQAMEMRQLGVPMSDIPSLKKVDPNNPGPNLHQTITIAAYDTPQYQTEVQRHAAIVKYRDEVHAHCLDDWK